MLNRTTPLLLIAAAVLTTIFQAVYYAPQLPDPVASHFGTGGVADGSMGKIPFLVMIAGLQVGLAALLIGIGWLFGKLPPSLLNMANKEYWLHEDRRDETIRYHQNMLYWICAWTALLMVVVFQLTIEANLGNLPGAVPGGTPKLNTPVFWGVMVVYMLVVVAICGRLLFRFSKIPTPVNR